MENLKKLKPSKDLWIKIKWMGSYAKPAVPFLIFSIIVNIISAILIMIGTTGIRLSLRIITRAVTYFSADRVAGKYNVLIIGAGYCAAAIIREIRKE